MERTQNTTLLRYLLSLTRTIASARISRYREVPAPPDKVVLPKSPTSKQPVLLIFWVGIFEVWGDCPRACASQNSKTACENCIAQEVPNRHIAWPPLRLPHLISESFPTLQTLQGTGANPPHPPPDRSAPPPTAYGFPFPISCTPWRGVFLSVHLVGASNKSWSPTISISFKKGAVSACPLNC